MRFIIHRTDKGRLSAVSHHSGEGSTISRKTGQNTSWWPLRKGYPFQLPMRYLPKIQIALLQNHGSHLLRIYRILRCRWLDDQHHMALTLQQHYHHLTPLSPFQHRAPLWLPNPLPSLALARYSDPDQRHLPLSPPP